jgi:NAD+ synthase (glutamine-hydrolysing)
VVPNGSPYERNKDDVRLELCARRAREGVCALAYVNLVGGQDELVFDGDSLVVDATGALVARAAQFQPELLVVDLDLPAATAAMPDPEARFCGLRVNRTIVSSEPLPRYDPLPAPCAERLDDLGEIYSALVTGLRDYVAKNGFRTVLMGLSGGIDSTLVAAIACDALGAERVYGVSNPSEWSSEHSRTDAAELARRTGLHLDTVPIAAMVDAFGSAVKVDGLAEENLQARIRAVVWMALSNQHGHLVLACGNKSELATGYSTIYGDAVGGYAPIKDVPKTLVWKLARWRNEEAARRGEQPPIPEGVITKPPSAELRPGQLDSDSLPPYQVLDAVLDAYVEQDRGSRELVADGFDPALVERVVAMVDRAEYKRRQFPTGPKISARNFGRDRRVPITNRWREQL